MDGFETRLQGLFVGQIEARWPDRPPSAIGKRPHPGPLTLTETGFREDAQADRAVHGGPDKAVHYYPAEHYPFWRGEVPARAGRLAPGGFGENLSAEGLTEGEVAIGDVFALGEAVAEVSQGRQPCWKLDAHLEHAGMAFLFTRTGRTGWYFRVLEPGRVAPGDRFARLERRSPEHTVARVAAALLAPGTPASEAALLAGLPGLAESWRQAFLKKAGAGR